MVERTQRSENYRHLAERLKAPHSKCAYPRDTLYQHVSPSSELSAKFDPAASPRPTRFRLVPLNWVAFPKVRAHRTRQRSERALWRIATASRTRRRTWTSSAPPVTGTNTHAHGAGAGLAHGGSSGEELGAD